VEIFQRVSSIEETLSHAASSPGSDRFTRPPAFDELKSLLQSCDWREVGAHADGHVRGATRKGGAVRPRSQLARERPGSAIQLGQHPLAMPKQQVWRLRPMPRQGAAARPQRVCDDLEMVRRTQPPREPILSAEAQRTKDQERERIAAEQEVVAAAAAREAQDVLHSHDLAVANRLLRWTQGEQAARSDKLLEAARRRVWAEALQEHTELSGVTVTIQKNFKAFRRAPRPAPRSAGAALPREGRARRAATR